MLGSSKNLLTLQSNSLLANMWKIVLVSILIFHLHVKPEAVMWMWRWISLLYFTLVVLIAFEYYHLMLCQACGYILRTTFELMKRPARCYHCCYDIENSPITKKTKWRDLSRATSPTSKLSPNETTALHKPGNSFEAKWLDLMHDGELKKIDPYRIRIEWNWTISQIYPRLRTGS